MTTVRIYVNSRNPHKFLEVHNDGHYHNSVRQYMHWTSADVLNLLGDKCLHRWHKANLDELLNDYEFIGTK